MDDTGQYSDEVYEKGSGAMKLAMSMITAAMLMIVTCCCCGKKIREGVYQGIYEGARIENRGKNTPAERAVNPDPEYDRYSRERQERIESDTRQ
jgi:hypothetical protein